MQILLVRHGETIANTKNLFYGISESPLTINGVKQATLAGDFLRKIKFIPDVIFVSERERAKKTLEYMNIKSEEEITDSRLNEKNMGIIENLNYQDIGKKYPKLFDEWNKDYINYRIENGESWLDVYSRVSSILDEILEKYVNTDKKILLVCHGGVMSMAYTHIIGGNFDAMYSAYFTNCSMLRCQCINNKYVINGLFDSSELI